MFVSICGFGEQDSLKFEDKIFVHRHILLETSRFWELIVEALVSIAGFKTLGKIIKYSSLTLGRIIQKIYPFI